MAEVFLCETGQITPAARRELKRAGVVVVEVEDPAKCQFIRATETIPAEDMLYAALDALRSHTGSYASDQREQFTLNLFALIEGARRADQRSTFNRGKS